MNKLISVWLAENGRKGGAAATGDKKRRSKEHYQFAQKASCAAKLAKRDIAEATVHNNSQG